MSAAVKVRELLRDFAASEEEEMEEGGSITVASGGALRRKVADASGSSNPPEPGPSSGATSHAPFSSTPVQRSSKQSLLEAVRSVAGEAREEAPPKPISKVSPEEFVLLGSPAQVCQLWAPFADLCSQQHLVATCLKSLDKRLRYQERYTNLQAKRMFKMKLSIADTQRQYSKYGVKIVGDVRDIICFPCGHVILSIGRAFPFTWRGCGLCHLATGLRQIRHLVNR